MDSAGREVREVDRNSWSAPRAVQLSTKPEPRQPKLAKPSVPTISEKRCSVCGELKSLSAFYRKVRGAGGRDGRCKECRRERRDTPATRDRHLRNTYGISLAQYESMLGAQGGVCAICGMPEGLLGGRRGTATLSLAVDHDHATGHVRGLLCSSCNQGLGMFKHEASLLEAALSYLTSTEAS
jgi:hypothetical protein